MDSNKKNYILGISIMTIICFLVSIFLVIDFFQGLDKLPKRKMEFYSMLEKETGIEINSDTPYDTVDELEQKGIKFLVIPKQNTKILKPNFDFIIDRNGVSITRGLSKSFYDTGLKINDVITAINGQELSKLDYFEVYDYIYSDKVETKKFKLSDGKEIEYKYESSYITASSFSEDSLIVKVYDLDVTTTQYLYNICKNYQNITIDLSQATIINYESFVSYLSFFATNDDPLFTKPQGVKPYKGYRLSTLDCKVDLVVNENQDKGINFLLNNLKNDKVHISGQSENLKSIQSFNCRRVIDGNSFSINLYDYEVSIKESINQTGEEI